MRKLIAIMAAIGFIGSMTLSPVIAAQPAPGVAKSDDFSAACSDDFSQGFRVSQNARQDRSTTQ